MVTALACGGCFFVGLTRSMTGWVPGWAASSELSIPWTVAVCVLTVIGLDSTGTGAGGPGRRTGSVLVLSACAVTVLSAVVVQLQGWGRADAAAGVCLGALGVWLAGRGERPARPDSSRRPPSSPWG
ncbi:hypothetical protein [Kineococcus aurantiacus]|uniref:Uncharacterized protein n=1 Tax=Kineococcus aurantiacus TaxID=37633 RepID=A0A7Y9J328_9ACTN|nr:hypothetical protein [Kineococcus aurantiacus]NYD24892.1 hypothetical protein [Kineococcus aurantiacus]